MVDPGIMIRSWRSVDSIALSALPHNGGNICIENESIDQICLPRLHIPTHTISPSSATPYSFLGFVVDGDDAGAPRPRNRHMERGQSVASRYIGTNIAKGRERLYIRCRIDMFLRSETIIHLTLL